MPPVLAIVCVLVAAAQVVAPPTLVANIDLAKAFHARSAWRFIAVQGPTIADPDEGPLPGKVYPCLSKTTAFHCDVPLPSPPPNPPNPDAVWTPHYLIEARVVFPEGPSAPPLLLVETADLPIFDGNQDILTQVLAYRQATDQFTQIYSYVTGHNNNEEVRFVTSRPLRGSIISAEPTSNSPYGYWMTVNRLTSAYTYKQVLRYRSATRYRDGNPLAAIDSEMPSIEERLGLWRPGSPMPLPARSCPRPRLVHMELWCDQG